MHLKTQDARQFSRHLVKNFSVVNPTPGTGIAQAIESAFAATAALAVLRNTGSSGLVRPKYIRQIFTVAPASGSACHGRIALDSGVTRVTAAGSTLTGKNRDMSSAIAANGTFKCGVVVTNAATANVRYISQYSPMTVIPVVGDNLILAFCSPDEVVGAGFGTLAGTTGRQIIIPVGPVVLGPNSEMIVHQWYPSNASTAASWEIEAGWEESRK
jgi:hypothetical protein